MKALYIGSFDPFTNGHLDIIKQAEQIFDEVLIAIASNPSKERRYSEGLCANAIYPYLGNNTKIGRAYTDDLTTELMELNECDYLIRGLRNVSDYLYEEQLFQMYKELKPDIKVMYLRANNNISSSFVSELIKRKKDVSKYIPYDINQLDIMKVKWNKDL